MDEIDDYVRSTNNIEINFENTQDETIKQIMIQSNEREIKNLCMSNKRFSKLCRDKFFMNGIYHEKIKKLFSQGLISTKPDGMGWRDFYNHILKTKLGNFEDMENIFAELSKNKFAQEILDLKDSEMSWSLFYDVVLKFKNNPSITAEDFEKGDLLKIKLYWNATKILSPDYYWWGAPVDMLKFGKSIGLKIDYRFANSAANKNQLNSLEYLKKLKLYPNKDALDRAVIKGYLEILEFCVSIGLKPTHINLYEAMMFSRENIIIYLINEFDMFPTQEDLSQGMKDGRCSVVHKCLELGLKPTKQDMHNWKTWNIYLDRSERNYIEYIIHHYTKNNK